jgi:hypothetical protein
MFIVFVFCIFSKNLKNKIVSFRKQKLKQKKKNMSKSLFLLAIIVLVVLATNSIVSATMSHEAFHKFWNNRLNQNQPPVLQSSKKQQQQVGFAPLPPPGAGNISAIFHCSNSSCDDQGCVSAQLVQNACTYVDVADSYIIYSCINGGTQVQLEVFGPLHFACTPKNPLHITKTFPTDECVLPNQAGGWTVYNCGN